MESHQGKRIYYLEEKEAGLKRSAYLFSSRNPRRICIILGVASILTALLFYIPGLVRNMSTEETRAFDPHLTHDSLALILQTTESSRPAIRVTLTNYHPTTSVSILIWDTPFDPKAVAIGIFHVTDVATGQELPALDLKLNRKLPPSREDFLEIKPRSAITKDVVLEVPGFSLPKGKSYYVQATGRWKAIWHASVPDVAENDLKKIGGPNGLISWDFQSDVFRLDVP